MGDPIVTEFGNITPRTAAYTVKNLLERAIPYLVTEQFGVPYVIPNKSSKVAKWRRYLALTAATVPLAEGVTPTGQRITYTDVQVVMEQYGDIVTITDVIEDVHEDPVLNEAVDLCSEQMAETKEINRISVLKAGTKVYYASSTAIVTRGTVAAVVDRGDLRYVERQMLGNRARAISKLVRPTAQYATAPIAPAFFMLGHTDGKADLEKISGFTPIENYASPVQLEAEVGKIGNARIILTDLFDPWLAQGDAVGATGLIAANATNIDVYPLILLGKNAFGLVSLKGKFAAKPSVINPNQPSKSDPLGQRGYVGWKIWDANVILNDDFMYRIETGFTANPS
jgi:N4-gp56 family major capsid protein